MWLLHREPAPIHCRDFRVEMGIPFSITRTEYDEKTVAYYMLDRWYKSLWKFTSKANYKLDITEDYDNLTLL